MNFIAIDFETANGKRASICEVGICVVRNCEIDEKRSWLVQPEGNYYSYWNVQCHGITPEDTEEAPSFPEVWREIEAQYFDTFDLLVAHNALLIEVAWSKRHSFTGSPFRSCSGTARYAEPVRSTTTAATASLTSVGNYPYPRGNITAPAMTPRCAPASTYANKKTVWRHDSFYLEH